MRRLKLKDLLRNVSAFAAVSATGIDAGLLLADRTGALSVDTSWYINAPLGIWFITSIPVTISLTSRIMQQIDPNPGRIWGGEEGRPSPGLHAIPFAANGKQSTVLAHTARSIFGDSLAPEREVYRPGIWRVPVNGSEVTVRESELRTFLDIAHKRSKHQFSRRYWTQKRRPPLWREKYEAFMRLLKESGLVEGRRNSGRASGRLVIFPREAIMFLKYESRFRVV